VQHAQHDHADHRFLANKVVVASTSQYAITMMHGTVNMAHTQGANDALMDRMTKRKAQEESVAADEEAVRPPPKQQRATDP
jgi:hypothetical protein